MLRRLGRDVALYGGAEFFFKFIAFAVFPIYAHVFSVAQFGLWALLAVTATLLGFVVNLGVNQAVQRFYFDAGVGPADRPLIVTTGLLQLLVSASVIVTAVLLVTGIAAEPLERDYGLDRLLLTLALAAVIPDQILQFSLDTLRMQFTPGRFILLSFARSVVGTVLALLFVLAFDGGLHGLFAGTLIGSAAAVPLGLWLIRRDLGLRIDPRMGRALFAFGFPLTFASIAHWIYTSVDRWMLTEMSTAEQLGLYSIAAKYATVMTFVIAAFGQAWIPFAMKMARDDPDHRRHFSSLLTLWFFALAMLGLGLSLYSREALELLTPPDFWPAAAILPMLATGMVLYGTTLIAGLGITLERRTALFAWGTWVAALANFLLNLLLIPRFNAMGAAAATLIAYGLLSGFLLFWTQRLRPLPLESGRLLYSAGLVGLAVAASAVDFGEPGIGAFLLKAAVLALALVGAFAVGIVDRNMFNLVRAKDAI